MCLCDWCLVAVLLGGECEGRALGESQRSGHYFGFAIVVLLLGVTVNTSTNTLLAFPWKRNDDPACLFSRPQRVSSIIRLLLRGQTEEDKLMVPLFGSSFALGSMEISANMAKM